MKIVVNGVARAVEEGATVADVIILLGHDPQGRGIAVARNGEIVPRAQWHRLPCDPGDEIELLTAVQGG